VKPWTVQPQRLQGVDGLILILAVLQQVCRLLRDSRNTASVPEAGRRGSTIHTAAGFCRPGVDRVSTGAARSQRIGNKKSGAEGGSLLVQTQAAVSSA